MLALREPLKPRSKPEKLAICAGTISLAPEDRVELLAVLSADPEEDIAERARGVLVSQPLDAFLKALARPDAAAPLLSYCAENLVNQTAVADALAANPGSPAKLLPFVAGSLSSAGVQTLLDNLERLVSDPLLVEALQHAPGATPEQREWLAELQKGSLTPEEAAEAAEAIEPDAEKRQTLQQQLAHMSVVQRITLALKGGRSERQALIRDPNKLVQRCVLQSPRLTDSEVENFASMSNLSTEVLRSISLMRIFMKNYTVARNLCNNPKTPLDATLHLFPRLNATDLFRLTTNKNIPETLRSSATKLHRKRKMGAAG